jgi:hypothetical protein
MARAENMGEQRSRLGRNNHEIYKNKYFALFTVCAFARVPRSAHFLFLHYPIHTYGYAELKKSMEVR